MTNLSWLLYKGYYEDFPNEWWNARSDDKVTENKILAFIKGKHAMFQRFRLAGSDSEQTHDFILKVMNHGLLYGAGAKISTGVKSSFQFGFDLDYTTGLPILHGSSIKGAIRSRFPQLPIYKSEKNKKGLRLLSDAEVSHLDEKEKGQVQKQKAIEIFDLLFKGSTMDPCEKINTIYLLELNIFEGIHVRESFNELKYLSNCSSRDLFYEAIPISGPEGRLFETDVITPHGEDPLKNPVPLPFLKVMPGVSYGFRFKMNEAKIEINSQDITITAKMKRDLFQSILCDYGLGAKTNVGYGQFQPLSKPKET